MHSRWPVLISFFVIFLSIHFIYFSKNVFADRLYNQSLITDGQQLIAESNIDEDQSLEQSLRTDPSLFSILLKMFFALAIVLGLIYIMLKILNRRQNLFQQVNALENLGGISVGQNKTIQIVRVGSALYMIGVGDNVELLKEIKDEQTIKDLTERQLSTDHTFKNVIEKLFSQEDKYESSDRDRHLSQSLRKELETMRKQRQDIIQHIEQREDKHE